MTEAMTEAISPLAYVNSSVADRVTEILKNIEAARDGMRGNPNVSDGIYWYWQGFLDCFCEQNAITDEAVELLADEAGLRGR